ncbi:MAG: hypothetical protein HY897_04510 [Deltaproteobacteria bacterium]|nr:hypothetical protein [Deltaproteobacteria bacterium]
MRSMPAMIIASCLLFPFVGCSTAEKGGGGNNNGNSECTRGDKRECDCEGGRRGVQVCVDDGLKVDWQECGSCVWPEHDAGSGEDGGAAACAAANEDCTTLACCIELTCDPTTKKCATPSVGGQLGDECVSNAACEEGICFSDNGHIPRPYCSVACTADTDCGFPGGIACCNNGICEIVGGSECGARQGELGDPCASAGSSDCAAGYFCVGARRPDGFFDDGAICSRTCTADNGCHLAEKRSTECLACFSGSYTRKLCQRDPNCYVTCAKDADCDATAGEQCALAATTDALGNLTGLEWSCKTTCIQGSKKFGEACSDDTECCSFFCMKGQCTGACATTADCGADHVCTQFTFGLDEFDQCKQADVDMCILLKGSKTPCEGNTDCATAAEYCQYAADENGNPATYCGDFPADGLNGGEDCSAGTKECKGGFCSTIGCLDWCRTDADCGGTAGKMTCTYQQMTDTAGKGICMRADGSQNPCTKDTDCPAGEACKTFPIQGGANNICVTVNPGGKDVGEDCSFDVPCANDLCLSNGVCSSICSSRADCPGDDPGTNWFCVSIGLGCDSSTHACVPMPGSGTTCTMDADCRAGEVCKLVLLSSDTYTLSCSTASKDGDISGAPPGSTCCGDPCNPECRQCANDMCFFALGESYACSAACETDADCPVAVDVAWTCQVIGGGTKLCVPTPGSGSRCRKDADCPNGEVCQVTICGTPYTNGDQPGSPIGGPCGTCSNPCDPTCVATACYNGMCTRGGTCTGACDTNANCGNRNYVCYHFTDAGGEIGQCVTALEVLVESCASDAECANAQENFCVDPGNGALHCGVQCDAAVPDSCPSGYDCKAIRNPDDSVKGFNCVIKI